MRTWTQTVEEAMELYSPIGLRLIDELTGGPPIGRIEVYLDVKTPAGTWAPTGASPVITPRGIVSYPGLERHANVTGLGSRRYRVRLKPEFYIPFYRASADGIEIDAFPYNDTKPPATIKKLPDDTLLTPAPNYPFQPHIPILHGVVVDAVGDKVPDAFVNRALVDRVITDWRGTFSLPLPRTKRNVNFVVDAANQRNGQMGVTGNLQLPGALSTVVKIQIQ